MTRTLLTCDCGSGQRSYPQYDDEMMLLCYTCGQCHQWKMGKYRRREDRRDEQVEGG